MAFIRVNRLHWPEFRVLVYGIFDTSVKYPSGQRSEPHTIAPRVFELGYFPSESTGRAVIDGTEHSIHRGTFLCGKPGQLRSSIFPLRSYYFHISTADPELVDFLTGIPDTGILPNPAQAETIFQSLLSIEDPTTLPARLAIHKSACQFIELLSQAAQIPTGNMAHLQTMLAAEKYIQEHLSEPLTLADVARAANLSPYYFHHLFTEYFGKTPAQYILDYRIAAAKLALLEENCSISALAVNCGFSSHSYFSQKFRQVTGKTPLQYRREMLGQLDA